MRRHLRLASTHKQRAHILTRPSPHLCPVLWWRVAVVNHGLDEALAKLGAVVVDVGAHSPGVCSSSLHATSTQPEGRERGAHRTAVAAEAAASAALRRHMPMQHTLALLGILQECYVCLAPVMRQHLTRAYKAVLCSAVLCSLPPSQHLPALHLKCRVYIGQLVVLVEAMAPVCEEALDIPAGEAGGGSRREGVASHRGRTDRVLPALKHRTEVHLKSASPGCLTALHLCCVHLLLGKRVHRAASDFESMIPQPESPPLLSD